MKKMLFAFAILLGSAAAYAQEAKPMSEAQMQQVIEKMDKTVKLTSDQKIELFRAYKNSQMRMESVMKEGDKDQVKSNLNDISKMQELRLKQILTPEQYAKWSAANARK